LNLRIVPPRPRLRLGLRRTGQPRY